MILPSRGVVPIVVPPSSGGESSRGVVRSRPPLSRLESRRGWPIVVPSSHPYKGVGRSNGGTTDSLLEVVG
jgi:hypothetical protein